MGRGFSFGVCFKCGYRSEWRGREGDRDALVKRVVEVQQALSYSVHTSLKLVHRRRFGEQGFMVRRHLCHSESVSIHNHRLWFFRKHTTNRSWVDTSSMPAVNLANATLMSSFAASPAVVVEASFFLFAFDLEGGG